MLTPQLFKEFHQQQETSHQPTVKNNRSGSMRTIDEC
jgi:hypothetical protein